MTAKDFCPCDCCDECRNKNRTIYVITWSDGYDSGACFYEAYSDEKVANDRAAELNKTCRPTREEYFVQEYELNSKSDSI